MLVFLAHPLGHYEQQGIHYSTTMEGEQTGLKLKYQARQSRHWWDERMQNMFGVKLYKSFWISVAKLTENSKGYRQRQKTMAAIPLKQEYKHGQGLIVLLASTCIWQTN